MNENTLIENAILAFLHNYPEHHWVDEYKILLQKVKSLNSQSHAEPKDTAVQKRGRPAKRQRKKETASREASEEKNQTTTEET